MGQQILTRHRRKPRIKQENNESVSDYHCYSCNLSSEQKIEHNNIFKELLEASLRNQPQPKMQRSKANEIFKNNTSSLLQQSMAFASVISEAYSKEISLNYLLSYRLEHNIGQLDYSILNQGFDSSQSNACYDYNEKIFKKFNRYNIIDNAESDANRYKNYLMNDTISTRNESTIKGKVKVVVLNNNNRSNNKHSSDISNRNNNYCNNNSTNTKDSQISNISSIKEKSIKEQSKITLNTPTTSEASSRKVSPRNIVILPPQITTEQKKNISNNITKQDLNSKKDNKIKPSKIRVFEIKPQTKGGGKGYSSKEKENTNKKVKELSMKNKSKDKIVKSPELKLNISTATVTSKENAKSPKSPSSKVKRHIYNPNHNYYPNHDNNTTISKDNRTPETILKKGNFNNNPNQNKRIKVKNLNININSLNVINTVKEMESNTDDHRSKSNNQPTKGQRPFPNFKVNLSQVLGRTSNENNSNSTEKEKYSINSSDSNPRDIRRIDTPQFHQHKKSQSSKGLCEFNPNLYNSNANASDQPLSGEKFSFSKKYSSKGQIN